MDNKKIYINYIILGIGIGIIFSAMIHLVSSGPKNQIQTDAQNWEWAKSEGLYSLKEITDMEENKEYYIFMIDENMTVEFVKKMLIESKICSKIQLEEIDLLKYELNYGLKKIKYGEKIEVIISEIFKIKE